MKKVAIFSSDSKSLYFFRSHLMSKLVHEGYQVNCYCSNDFFFKEAEVLLREKGVSVKELNFKNTSKNLFFDLSTLYKIYKILRSEKPDYIFSYHIKPVLYTTLMGRLFSNSKFFPTITGLGYLFTSRKMFIVFLRKLIYLLSHFSFKNAEKVFFQNKDDLSFFIENKILTADRAIVVNGSGIDLTDYSYHELPENLSFIFVGRLNRDKGIYEYIDACLDLKKRYPEISFKIIGSSSANPTAISREDIEFKDKLSRMDYIGEVRDVKKWLIESSVFVLPSYREGAPRAGIEALAIGRPIITTTAIGCREIVQNGINGYAISPRNVQELKEAIVKMIESPFHILENMSRESRRLAEIKFNVEDITNKMIDSIK